MTAKAGALVDSPVRWRGPCSSSPGINRPVTAGRGTVKNLAEQQAAYGETWAASVLKKGAMTKTLTKTFWPRRVAEGFKRVAWGASVLSLGRNGAVWSVRPFVEAQTHRHEHRSRNKWGGDRYADPRKGSRAGAKCGARSQQGIRCSADTQVQVEAPFEYAERLASLLRRQQEIEDELDLTRQPGTESP